MNKRALSPILLAAALFISPAAFATDGSWNVDASGNWSTGSNWTSDPLVPDGAGSIATLILNITGNRTVTLDTTPRTVGHLTIGDTDGSNSYTLNASGGATLTFDTNGGGNATLTQFGGSAGDTISAPIVLNGFLVVTNQASNTFNLTGPITGTGALIVGSNVTAGGNNIVFSGLINMAGDIVNTGTGTNTIRMQGGIGSNVQNIYQSSSSSVLTLASMVTVNSVSTTFVNNGGAGFVAEQGATGTGNIILQNDTSSATGVKLGGSITITGTVTNSGTGTGTTEISPLGTGVTGVIQSSSSSNLEMRNGTTAVGSGGLTLTNTGGALIRFLQSSSGSGDLILNNNSSVDQAIQVQEQTLNNTGHIVNSGTGTGESFISATLGTSLGGIVQNSSTSALELRVGSSSSAFTGNLTVQSGTMKIAGNSVVSGASKILVGDTAAHGAGSHLDVSSLDGGGTLTLGATQTLAGFGNVSAGKIATAAGSTIAPGDVGSIGTLTITNQLLLAGGSALTFDLGTAGSGLPSTGGLSDLLAIGGQLTLGDTSVSKFQLTLNDNANANGQGSLSAGTYKLITYGSLVGASAGDITDLFNVTAPSGYTYAISNTGTGEIDVTVTAAQAVPEPGTWALLLGGLGLFFVLRRSRPRL